MTAPATTPEQRPQRAASPRFVVLMFVLIGVAIAIGRLLAGVTAPPTAPATGSESVRAGSPSPVTIVQTSTMTGLFPGGPAQRLSGAFHNTGGSEVFISEVEAAIVSVTGIDGNCTAANYRIDNPVMPVGLSIPSGQSVGEWGGATIRMIDVPVSQDACQLATVNISYVAR